MRDFMDRFEDNQEDDFYDEYDDDYDDDDEEEDMPSHVMSRWKESELALRGDEINLAILSQTVDILSHSFFWRFKSHKTKLKEIIATYYSLIRMMDVNNAVYSS